MPFFDYHSKLQTLYSLQRELPTYQHEFPLTFEQYINWETLVKDDSSYIIEIDEIRDSLVELPSKLPDNLEKTKVEYKCDDYIIDLLFVPVDFSVNSTSIFVKLEVDIMLLLSGPKEYKVCDDISVLLNEQNAVIFNPVNTYKMVNGLPVFVIVQPILNQYPPALKQEMEKYASNH